MRKGPVLAAAVLAWVAVGIACGGNGSTPAAETPAITMSVTPGITRPDATPEQTGFPPGVEVRRFLGQTIAFSYPTDWYVWKRNFESGQETVVLANIPQEQGAGGVPPPGAMEIEFLGRPWEPHQAVPGDIVQSFYIAGVHFTLRQGGEVPWMLTGGFKIGGVNFQYAAKVLMNTPEPQMDVLRPILESWVVGSTNHHPPRSCISPGECP